MGIFGRKKFKPNNPKIADTITGSRKDRAALTKKFAGIGAGAAVGVAVLDARRIVSGPVAKGLAEIAALSAAAGAIGAGIGYIKGAKLVRSATRQAGRLIISEARSNPEMRRFLGKYRYVYLDRKGNLAGTNLPKLPGIGRIRLKTSKLLGKELTKYEMMKFST